MLERYSATVPLRTTDREDVPLALIPVAGHDRPAIIEADDHRQLLSHGHFDRLELWGSDPRRYVVAISRVGSSIIVARMVGNAGRSGYVARDMFQIGLNAPQCGFDACLDDLRDVVERHFDGGLCLMVGIPEKISQQKGSGERRYDKGRQIKLPCEGKVQAGR